MIPLRIVETDREGFDEPVVEIWRDDEFVGMVFWDEDVPVVQIFPDDDGDVRDLDLRDLMQQLDLAEQIVTPDDFREDGFETIADRIARATGAQTAALAAGDEEYEWEDEDPMVLALVDEFDPEAIHRSEDGEGFFPHGVAASFIRKCEELDLAVVEMEGFDWDGDELLPRPNMNLVVRSEAPQDWGVFRTQANFQALDALAQWSASDSLVVAFVVQSSTGETFVV